MSREIKFRIWDKRQNKYIFEREACSNRLAVSLHGKVYSGKFDNVLSDNDYVIQQYTGLKDSKGKEIYEGDIMASRGNYITEELDENGKYLDLINVVVWNVKSSRFALKPITEYVKELKHPIPHELDYPWTCYLTTFKEVIGNIFENPELLKQ